MTKKSLEVCAAVMFEDGRFLITQRMAHAHCSLLWEFPGGKCHPGESHAECLRREILEELGLEISVGDRISSISHDYEDFRIILHFYKCVRLQGEPQLLQCNDFRWVTSAQLSDYAFPEADSAFLSLLRSFVP